MVLVEGEQREQGLDGEPAKDKSVEVREDVGLEVECRASVGCSSPHTPLPGGAAKRDAALRQRGRAGVAVGKAHARPRLNAPVSLRPRDTMGSCTAFSNGETFPLVTQCWAANIRG